MPRRAKRARKDDDSEEFASDAQPSYADMISQLKDDTLRRMVNDLAMTSPSVQTAIRSYYQQLIHSRRTVDLNFDSYSRVVWRVLNSSEYAKGSGSKQYDSAWDATDEVRGCIRAIANKTHPESSYGTKLSALKTLCKIAKTLLLAGNTLGSEVRKQFQTDSCLPDKMLRIAQLMSPQEQLRAGATSDAEGSLVDKVRWLCDEWDSYCLDGIESFDTVLDLLGGSSDASEE
ncbi:hypothetical protein O1611_g2924 [Lasiodiplodia mahajangana]|uniref:Uncharacterized protein n=1 Tax=Lasiodiplodia mahajangana TaxID=1108764 RepID=A0ACC2JT62_9PEZI|nr:hypothetical protein O1611_g2924 [Lasiodiplodia mahajangana]